MEGAVGIPDLGPIMTALTKAVTVENIIELIASMVTFALPYVLMWFGYRFVKRAFTKAVISGRI